MGSTDYGNQILTFDYKQTATSQGFNKLNYEILSPGIYKGGLLTKNTDTLVDVSPLICFIEDKLGNGLGVRIETTTTPNIIVDPTIPYIILRFEWANTDNDYADIMGVAQASLLSTDLILGICLFDGSVMRTVFDYTTRNFKGNLGITTGIEYNKPENLHLGDISVDIINNTTSLSIRADSYVEIDGMYINYTQDIQIIDTPTNSVNNYIYIEKNTNGILKFNTTAPVWNDSKRGWYDAGGTQRYLGMAYYDGANFSKLFVYMLESMYASTVAGKGASKIGINDTGSLFSGTTVEAVLQELNRILGKIYINLTNDTISKIGKGSYVEVNKHFIDFSANTIITGSLTSFEINYIYIDNNGVSVWSIIKPKWNENKRGWYNLGFTQRCVGRVYYDGDRTINKSVYNNLGKLHYDIIPYNNIYTKRALANPAVQKWSAQVSAADNNWTSVTWSPELGLFCAVANSGVGNRVMTSPDGINWTIRVSAADNSWWGIAWSPELGLFCAVAYSGVGNRVMTSPDGVNWTIRVSAADNGWHGVTWSPELGLFCAVANSGVGNRVMTSSDGVNWTIRSSAADNNWRCVTWSPELGLFCAVANSGTGNRVMTSPDGVNWTIRSSVADNEWRGITWSPELGLFCAMAMGIISMTSPDGINWTIRSNAANNNWYGLAWSPELGLFCTMAASGVGNRVMTSPDGINWTIRISAADNSWFDVAWSPELGLFCTVAASGVGNRVMINI